MSWAVGEDDLSDPQTQALLLLHIEAARANSPPGETYALDLSGLKVPGITVWTARAGDRVAAIGALRSLGEGVGELKSMRTHPDFLRQGAAAAILETLIAAARSRGYTRLCLETGSGEAFEPALAMYRSRGFVPGAVYGAYPDGGFSQFLHLNLQPPAV